MLLKTFLTILFLKFSFAEENPFGQTRVVNGDLIQIEQAPYYCSLFKPPTRHHCGGAIIATKWILSAAHCYADDKEPKNYKVRTGSTRISRGGVITDVTKIILHDYNAAQNSFDFALLQLKSTLQMSDQTSVIKLPTAGYEMTEGTEVFSCGHGETKNPLHSNELFRGVILTVSNFKACKAAYKYIMEPTFCVTSPEKNQGNCFGDSGGPIEELKSGNLVGVVSFGSTTCSEADGQQGVLAKVSAVRPWIKKHVGI